MDNASLAQSFNRVGKHLTAGGHRVVIRRARELTRTGDVAAASSFLADAADRLTDPELRELSDSFVAWQAAGGDPAALCAQADWIGGAAAEDQPSQAIAAATAGDLNTLLAARLAHGAALALADPALPEEPTSPFTGKHAIGSIFGAERRVESNAAVIEAPSQLEPRTLDLGDEPASAAGPVDPMAATEVMEGASAALRAMTKTPAPPAKAPEPDPFEAVATAAAPTPPAKDVALPAADTGGFAHMPELHAPPSMVAPPAPKPAAAGNGMVIALGAIAAAAIGAAAWFFFK